MSRSCGTRSTYSGSCARSSTNHARDGTPRACVPACGLSVRAIELDMTREVMWHVAPLDPRGSRDPRPHRSSADNGSTCRARYILVPVSPAVRRPESRDNPHQSAPPSCRISSPPSPLRMTAADRDATPLQRRAREGLCRGPVQKASDLHSSSSMPETERGGSDYVYTSAAVFSDKKLGDGWTRRSRIDARGRRLQHDPSYRCFQPTSPIVPQPDGHHRLPDIRIIASSGTPMSGYMRSRVQEQIGRALGRLNYTSTGPRYTNRIFFRPTLTTAD